MSDLADLFASVDGITDDLVEFGALAGGVVVANVGFNVAAGKAIGWLEGQTFVPTAVKPYLRSVGVPVMAAAATLGSAALAQKYARRGLARNLAMGVSVGFALAGVKSILKTVAPTLPLEGIGGHGLSANDDLYRRYLGDAPRTVETVGGLGTPSVTVERVSGLGNAPVSVEQVSGWADSGRASFVAALQ